MLTKQSNSRTAKQLKLSYVDFAKEIKNDLPYLMHEFQDGIYIHHLREYYGESSNRIHHALSVLRKDNVVDMHKAPDKTFYIVPHGATKPHLIELTEMQRRVVRFVMTVCKEGETTRMKTDYSQMARILKVSAGGLRASMDRLHQLGYLLIDNPSQIGFPRTMVLTIGPKLKKAFEEHHLAT